MTAGPPPADLAADPQPACPQPGDPRPAGPPPAALAADPLPGDAGGKARGLERIVAADLRTAPWFLVPAAARPGGAVAVPPSLAGDVVDACGELRALGARAFAVRSSALDEDGPAQSFAGQYLTLLDVPDSAGVVQGIGRCWASSDAPTVAAYRAAAGLATGTPGIAVIVQTMVDADFAGVAFSRAPDGEGTPDEAVVAATRGCGAPLVAGEVSGDEYRVRPDGSVVVRRTEQAGARYLDDDDVRAIAEASRRLERQEGAPQDVEWALTSTHDLYVLQTRPITAMGATARAIGSGQGHGAAGGPRVTAADLGSDARDRPPMPVLPGDTIRVWDNANIVESFSGITLPLTYSVARDAYAAVYRSACRSLGVREATLDANADLFEQMLGHIDGRVYYNVGNWHRLLALLPGFGTNQRFLERMMGAGRPGAVTGEHALMVQARRLGLADIAGVAARTGVGLLLFGRRAQAFERRIQALTRRSRTRDLDAMTIDELLAYYDQVRAEALEDWHVTIFNDLAVMVVHGELCRLAEGWLGARSGPVVNRALHTDGLASVAPAAELRQIARRFREQPICLHALQASSDPLQTLQVDTSLAPLRALVDAYLDRWGDRCPSELQLERPTFADDPRPLLSVIVSLAALPDDAAGRSSAPGEDARVEVEQALSCAPLIERHLRTRTFRALVEMTRYRLAWRERMRFARTEVFAVARRIFRAMDRGFVEAGLLERSGDLHYLDIVEVRGAIRGTLPPVDLRALVANRRSVFARLAQAPAPPSRLETAGAVVLARSGAMGRSEASAASPAHHVGPDVILSGSPVWAGVAHGPCRRVEDPRAETLLAGDIVVARSTDPGWVPLLLSAAGLLVERGSVLSHSAIVARELRLPTIVGIDGLMAATTRCGTADMDGSTGRVRLEMAREGST